MITLEELLKGKKLAQLDDKQVDNLAILLRKIGLVRALWNRPMVVTNCVRTMVEHLAIYAKNGITDISLIPMKSHHLYAEAVDIDDKDGSLYQWCQENEKKLLEIGLWIEKDTLGWVHFQIVPYGSWKKGMTIFFQAVKGKK